jgi:hypothetical protein
MNKMICLLLLPLFAMPIACSKSKSKSSIPRYFYHGDPMEMISGSTTNPKMGFDKKTYTNFDNYTLSSIVIISEKSERESVERENAEEGNEATESLDSTNRSNLFSFTDIVDNKITYKGSYSGFPLQLDFEISSDDTLILKNITAENASAQATLLHYSVTPNQRMFSVLAFATDDDGKYLVSMVFAKDLDPSLVKSGDDKYFYLEGKGVMVAWNKSKVLEVNLCLAKDKKIEIQGKYANFRLPITNNFIKVWQKALEPLLTITYKETDKYPPFSDLNTHCVYVLDSYLTEQNPTLLNYGMALTINDISKSEIVDSDIFLNSAEFAKQVKVYDSGYGYVSSAEISKHLLEKLEYTLVHEFGHFLGLDHVFDGTNSVMSYEFGDPMVSDFDRESIRYLYK